MFDMMHTPTPGTTGSRTNDEPAAPTASPRRATFRRATLATAASLTMLAGAVTAATSPIAHAAPADPAAQTECEHVDDPARLDDAISRAIAEGHIAAGHDWAPNKALEFLPGNCGEVVAQLIAALGGEPSSPTALLLYHPVDGRYVTTAEVPGFVAEGPAWGTNISGMSRIERTTPQEITVWWKNTAGETATMRYLWDQGRYHALYEEGSQ